MRHRLGPRGHQGGDAFAARRDAGKAGACAQRRFRAQAHGAAHAVFPADAQDVAEFTLVRIGIARREHPRQVLVAIQVGGRRETGESLRRQAKPVEQHFGFAGASGVEAALGGDDFLQHCGQLELLEVRDLRGDRADHHADAALLHQHRQPAAAAIGVHAGGHVEREDRQSGGVEALDQRQAGAHGRPRQASAEQGIHPQVHVRQLAVEHPGDAA